MDTVYICMSGSNLWHMALEHGLLQQIMSCCTKKGFKETGCAVFFLFFFKLWKASAAVHTSNVRNLFFIFFQGMIFKY